MKISRVGSKTQSIGGSSTDKVQKSGDFSDMLDMANKEHSEQQLYEMLKDIEKLGNNLVKTKSLTDARFYKEKIKEYISYIVKNTYLLKTETSPFSFGIHQRVEIINDKLDDLTKGLMEGQRDAIDIADKIEEIKGLLVDVLK
jgi:uncharacterized protein YaaR (DUF327 family)